MLTALMISINRASCLFKYALLAARTFPTNPDRGCQVRASATWANASSELVDDAVNLQKVPSRHSWAAPRISPFVVLCIPPQQVTFFAGLSSEDVSGSLSV